MPASCCRGLWKCVSPFIEPETLKKVQWVYASDPAELRRSFDVKVSAFAGCQPCRWHCGQPDSIFISLLAYHMPQSAAQA